MKRKFARNIGWTALTAGIDVALAAAIGIACARYMGNSAYGGLSAATTIFGLFRRFTTGGLEPPTTREIARAAEPGEAADWEASARRRILKNTLIWAPVSLLVSTTLPPEIGWPLAIFSLTLCASFADARGWRLQAILEKRQEILPDRLGQAASGIARISLLALAAPGWLFALGPALANWVRACLLSLTMKQTTPGKACKEKERRLKTAALHLLPGVLTKYALGAAPLLVLSAISTASAGDYWAATRAAGLAAMPAAIYLPSAHPEVLAGRGRKKHLCRALVLALIGGASLAAAGPWIMPLLYGPGFAHAGICASILGIGVAATGASALLESVLVSHGLESQVSRSSTTGGIAALACGALLLAGGTPAVFAAAATTAGSQTLTAALLAANTFRLRQAQAKEQPWKNNRGPGTTRQPR